MSTAAVEETVGILEQAAAVPLDEKPTVPTAGEAAPPTVGEHYRLYALAALTAIIFALCVVVALPFLRAITWAIALAIVATPLHRWLCASFDGRRPGLAAGIATAIVSTTILGTGIFVAYHISQKAPAIVQQTSSTEQGAGDTADRVRETAERIPGVSSVASWMRDVGVPVERAVREVLGTFTRDFSGVVQGSAASIAQFLAAVFLLFFLFRDRRHFLEGLRDMLPLTRAEADHIFTRAADSVHANLYATFVTSLVSTTGIGLMFWYLGLPNPLLWTVVMFILSLLPIVGAGMVWLPAAAYLAIQGSWLSGAALIGWSLIFFVFSDNILYAKLAGPRMRMHEALALLSFFGGLAVFGISGMVLGPAILALSLAFLEIWKFRLTGTEPATAIVTGGDTPALA